MVKKLKDLTKDQLIQMNVYLKAKYNARVALSGRDQYTLEQDTYHPLLLDAEGYLQGVYNLLEDRHERRTKET